MKRFKQWIKEVLNELFGSIGCIPDDEDLENYKGYYRRNKNEEI